MVWWIQPLEIAGADGEGTGRWRLTAKSDEGGGGPYGDTSHDHASAEEADACDQCDPISVKKTYGRGFRKPRKSRL